jgi:hypothetical protein
LYYALKYITNKLYTHTSLSWFSHAQKNLYTIHNFLQEPQGLTSQETALIISSCSLWHKLIN